MKFGMLIVGIIIVGAGAGHFLLSDPGYVVINFRDYIIEMSVPVLIALLLFVFLLCWIAWSLLRATRNLGKTVGGMKTRRAGKHFSRGLVEISEGNFAKGERLLTRAAGAAETPALNYLAAARAAQQQGASKRRDNWLKLAYEKSPEAANAVLLTQAELQLASGEHEQALASLKKLQESSPNNPQALTLLARVYHGAGEWQQLQSILPKIRKQKRIDPSETDRWELDMHTHLLTAAVGDKAARASAWTAVPKALKTRPALRAAYAKGIVTTEEPTVAETQLRKMLAKQWDPALVSDYGLLQTPANAKQLKRVESWLKTHPDDADLLLAAGRLCMRDELWGKARSYIESSLAIRAEPQTYQEYGNLLNSIGEDHNAANAYKSGLALVHGPDVPALTDQSTD